MPTQSIRSIEQKSKSENYCLRRRIWLLDLAIVDKLAKENKDVEYLLLAVDCLSRYLRVQSFKSKYAATTVDAFKKMIKEISELKGCC